MCAPLDPIRGTSWLSARFLLDTNILTYCFERAAIPKIRNPFR